MPRTKAFYCLIPLIVLNSRLICACQLRQCDHWRITVIPLLTEEFNQFTFLKALVRALIDDCKWYAGHTELRFLNKHGRFIRVQNFETQKAIDGELEGFTYARNETKSAYFRTVRNAIMEMPRARSNLGRYIFIATDFEHNQTSNNKELRTIDRFLKAKEIQMRSFQLDINEIVNNPSAIINVQAVRRISSRLLRVSLTEADNVITSIKPCRPMTEAERIRSLQYERDAHFRYWLTNNSWDVTVGLLLFLSSVLVALIAFVVHLWRSKHQEKTDI